MSLSGIKQFHYRAVIAERSAATKVGHRREDIFEGSAFRSDVLQTLVIEKVATSIFCFGDAIGNQHQSITRMHIVVVALVSGIRQQPDRQVAVRGTDRLVITR